MRRDIIVKISFLLAALIIVSISIYVLYKSEVNVGVEIGNAEPAITSVSLVDQNEVQVNILRPYNIYKLYITVQDNNMISDIAQIKIILYSYQSSLDAQDSESDHYTIVYSKSTGSFSSNISGVVQDYIIPDLSRASGVFMVSFMLKLARASTPVSDYWNGYIIAIDLSGANATYSFNFDVDTYAEISLSDLSINFHGLPGETKVPSNPAFIIITVYSNYLWSLQIKATDLTGTNNHTIPATNLYVDDDAQPDEVQESGAPIQNLNTTYENLLGFSGSYVNGQDFIVYFFVDLPSPLPIGNYYGTIYITVVVG